MDDQQLITQVLRGQRQAFAGLVERHQRPLGRYLARMGFTREEVKDLAQECFIRAYRHLAQFDPGRARFSTWLFTIARRLAIDELRRPARHRHEPIEAAEACVGAQSAGGDTLMQARVGRALAQLPPEFRSALALAYFQELSIEEIAAVEGCSSGTIKSRIHRGKERLRALLADLMPESLNA